MYIWGVLYEDGFDDCEKDFSTFSLVKYDIMYLYCAWKV